MPISLMICLLFLGQSPDLRIGSAAVEIVGDDSMVMAGGITGWFPKGQEGKLRATAVVVEKPGRGKIAIVACDVLFLTRDLMDPVLARVEKEIGIPRANVLANATHTHSAPSTAKVHGYGRVEKFCARMQSAVFDAIQQANAKLPAGAGNLSFRLGEESSVGQNSRLLLADQTIFWIGPRDDALRPTGPFDPELPVLAFRNSAGKPIATVFNHSTHTIGTRTGNVRSPSFYGLAAQELEQEVGGTFCFLEGASGSTHNLNLKCDEMILRMKSAVTRANQQALPMTVDRVFGIKKEVEYRVRQFDDAAEDRKVVDYCKKRAPAASDAIRDVFRLARRELIKEQGKTRKTWVQVLIVGEIAFVGVPAEFFTVLGQEIKRQSPYRYTYVAELANDWIGYLPDQEGFKLGGYQTWVGFHCPAEPGTGENIVKEAVELLKISKKSEK